ncbi:type II secretion system protein N [Novilysobacter selenitireducens]|uniref:Type II secretion system protein N n=1 Tax=Novilysobacter selenitireducens TaxID=2872639 RepID=A0ABS7T7A1_9GAMM|nr:type II secretion system protein N [Lysobacter selenitireducens]MBZ4039757.1 type II secretion system protein N [Lysobacter selenitireducens]
MSRFHLLLAFALSVAVSLVAFAPLGLAARIGPWPDGLNVRQVEGPLWGGQLTGVRWKGQAFDSVDAALHPLSWTWGIPRLALQAGGLEVALSGGRVQGLHSADGPIELAPSSTWSGLALTAQADGLQVLFADGRCLRAGGTLQVQAEGAAIPGDTVQLAGPARCDGEEARIDLSPTQPTPGQPEVRADVRLSADGRYRAAVRVVSQDPQVIAALALAEFQPGPGGASRVVEGRLGD